MPLVLGEEIIKNSGYNISIWYWLRVMHVRIFDNKLTFILGRQSCITSGITEEVEEIESCCTRTNLLTWILPGRITFGFKPEMRFSLGGLIITIFWPLGLLLKSTRSVTARLGEGWTSSTRKSHFDGMVLSNSDPRGIICGYC